MLPVGETLLDRILNELAAVLRSPAATVADKRSALWVLRDNGGPIVTRAFADGAADPTPEVRLTAVAGLFAFKDNSRIEEAVQALLQTPPDVSRETLHNVAAAIGLFVDDPKMISWLLRMQGSEDRVIRRSAAAALGRTRSRLAVPALARALDDSDSATRLEAVRGLSIILQDSLRPDQREFLADEKRYLEHYRAVAQEK
jgi:HEAT repeat protein